MVTWQKRFSNVYYIAAKKFDADGNIVKDSFLVTSDTTSYKINPKVGIDSLGNFAITYYGNKNNNYDVYLDRYNSSGEQLDSEIVVNDDKSTALNTDSDISVNSKGDCIVAWYDYRIQMEYIFRNIKISVQLIHLKK